MLYGALVADTPARFNQKLSDLEQSIAGKGARPMLARIGKAAAKDGTGAIKAKIRDTSMSHFTRKNPVDLSYHAYVTSDHEVVVGPARKAVGPSVILNSGHKAYAAGAKRLTGKMSKKTGKALTRKVKRATGAHGGKGTATEARRLMELRTPKRLDDEVRAALRKQFGG